MSRNKNRPHATGASLPAAGVHAVDNASAGAPLVDSWPPRASGEPGSVLLFVWKVHDQTHDLIRFADTKASIVLALTSGILSILFGAKIHHHFIGGDLPPGPLGIKEVLLAVASAASLLLLSVAIAIAVSAIAPRLGKRGRTSLVFWQGILEHRDHAAYSARLGPLTRRFLRAARRGRRWCPR